MESLVQLENERNKLALSRSDTNADVVSLDQRIAEVEGQLLAFLTGRDEVREIRAAAWTETGKAHAVGWHQFAAAQGKDLQPLREAGYFTHYA